MTALESAARHPFWFDTVPEAPPCPPLQGSTRCDLAIIGGGFTGLWSAVQASLRAPDARIVLIERDLCGLGASGRNGGFCAPSISHGIGVALRRWPGEAERLVHLGRQNARELAEDVQRLGMAVDYEAHGKLNLAEKPWQVEGLHRIQAEFRRFGVDCPILSGDALREKFDSPIYPAGLFEPTYALLNPARMVAELRRVALARRVEIHENTAATGLRDAGTGVTIDTAGGSITATRAILATNVWPNLLPKLRATVIPVYDYAITTRPLSEDELASIGWIEHHGIADSGNQFHYARKTADNRILWGGYDAVYHAGGRRDAALLDRPETFARLAANLYRALPQLDGIAFTHAWGGIIDTSARTTFFAGTDFDGRLAYALGFTGQGVSASRFAAIAMLDMLDGRETEHTRLAMLRRRPFRFPPEPLRTFGIRWAQRDLAREDATGRRSLFLRSLDLMGIGFDS